MNDPIGLALLIRGGIAATLTLGGVACLVLGCWLISKRKAEASVSTFEAIVGNFRVSFSAGTAGVAVVFVSAAWVLGAVSALPSLSQTPDGSTVAFGSRPGATLRAPLTVSFEGSNVALTSAHKRSLSDVATYIKGGVPRRVVVEGYASVDEPTLNAVIAQQRAQLVRDYLVHEEGVPRERITLLEQGESPPDSEQRKDAVVIRSTGDGG